MQSLWIIQRSKHLALAAAGSALLIGAAAAGAADTQVDSADSSAELQEIVVTANKRAQDAKDVPVSIGVIEGKELTDLHVDSYEDISRLVPGVSFAAHNNGPNGAGQDNITIRGVSSTVGNPTVGTYIDEVPIITITGYEGDAEPRLIDIDRIEVLRGPHGPLHHGATRFARHQRLLPSGTVRH